MRYWAEMSIPNETIGSEEIPKLSDKDQLIMVYCRSGNRSKQAAEKLAKLGYTNIVTKEEWYKQLFERLEASKFRSSVHILENRI